MSSFSHFISFSFFRWITFGERRGLHVTDCFIWLACHQVQLGSYFHGNYLSKGCTCLTFTSRLWLVLTFDKLSNIMEALAGREDTYCSSSHPGCPTCIIVYWTSHGFVYCDKLCSFTFSSSPWIISSLKLKSLMEWIRYPHPHGVWLSEKYLHCISRPHNL